MKKICVVTATRAEYGLLRRVIDRVHRDEELELKLVVTGAHLSPLFGMTVDEIVADGYPIDARIDILPGPETGAGITKIMGLAAISFADYFSQNEVDMLVVLGDRYELIPACFAAVNEGIPIAHIGGGELTEGAVDDCYRHCVTKMSYLHFPSCDAYGKRIAQLGEEPNRIFNHGDTGVENTTKAQFLSRCDLSLSLNISLERPYFCVTFHPVTLEVEMAQQQVSALLDAMEEYPQYDFIITGVNADAGNGVVARAIESRVSRNANWHFFDSLGSLRYLSLVKHSLGVIGNSSSGIIEAPALEKPTVNIGSRQDGRLKAATIVDCCPEKDDIVRAIDSILEESFMVEALKEPCPYSGKDTAQKIVETMKRFLSGSCGSVRKSFYDIPIEAVKLDDGSYGMRGLANI